MSQVLTYTNRLRTISRHLSTASSLSGLANGELSVSYTPQSGLVSYVLNRPKSLNALTVDQVNALDAHLRILKEDPSCCGILFEGAGDRAFCAGGDVLHVARFAPIENDGDDWNKRWFSAEFLLNHYIATFDKPVISIWRGIVMGGGVGLSIYGSHRIATESTVFAMPETGIGFFPDVGSSYFLSHLVKQPGLGLYLGMTGHRLIGSDVVHAGLATHYVSGDKLISLTQDLKKSARNLDQTMNIYVSENIPPAITLTGEFLTSVQEYFEETAFAEFWKKLHEGAAKNDPFALNTLKIISTKCPLTVRAWFESFKLGKTQSLPEVLAREYSMCVHATDVDPHNFCEGVRAQLIDKGKGTPPAYIPGTIGEVDEKQINALLFSKAGGNLLPFLLNNSRMYN